VCVFCWLMLILGVFLGGVCLKNVGCLDEREKESLFSISASWIPQVRIGRKVGKREHFVGRTPSHSHSHSHSDSRVREVFFRWIRRCASPRSSSRRQKIFHRSGRLCLFSFKLSCRETSDEKAAGSYFWATEVRFYSQALTG
jgi:hypothetical protein